MSFIKNWSNGCDSNTRFYGFAIRCIGPLCHRCINALTNLGGNYIASEIWSTSFSTHQLICSSRTTSTRFPTGSVLALLAPVWLDRTFLCEVFHFRTTRSCHTTSHRPGPDYPVTLERSGGETGIRTLGTVFDNTTV